MQVLNIDRLLAKLIIVLSLSSIPFMMWLGLAIELPLVGLCGGAVYLLLAKRMQKISEEKIYIKKANYNLILVLCSIFLLAFVSSHVILYYETQIRPPSYFTLISVSALAIMLIILIQGKSIKKTSWATLLLLFIFAVGLSLRITPYAQLIGYSAFDMSSHISLTNDLIRQGSLLDFPEDQTYKHFPLTHIYISILSLVTGQDVSESYIMGILFIESLVFLNVFLIGRKIFGTKAGLLAGLLTATSDHLIRWGTNTIPLSLGLYFVSLFLFMLLNHDRRFLAIGMLFFFSMIILHPLTNLIAIVILLLVLISRSLFFERGILHGTAIRTSLLLMSATLVYWIFFTGSAKFSEFGFAVLALVDLFKNTDSVIGIASAPPFELGLLGIRIFIFFGLIGSLSILAERQRDIRKKILVTVAAGLTGLTYFMTSTGVPEALIPDRWFSFSYVPLSIIAAVGLKRLYLALREEEKGIRPRIQLNVLRVFKNKRSILIVSTLFLLFLLPMTTNYVANSDSPLYSKEMALRLSLTRSEVSTAEFVMLKQPYFFPIATDYPMALHLAGPFFEDKRPYIPNTYDLYRLVKTDLNPKIRGEWQPDVQRIQVGDLKAPYDIIILLRETTIGKYVPTPPEKHVIFGYMADPVFITSSYRQYFMDTWCNQIFSTGSEWVFISTRKK